MEFFCKVKDPRAPDKVRHELEDVPRIALIGVLCSCEDYDEISDLIEDHEQQLLKEMGFLRLTDGVPSGDTIRRVLEAVAPEQMRASLSVSWERIISSLKGCHVIIDGKKLRGENSSGRGCDGLYILNALVSEYEICIAGERVDDRTNELAALPAFIASLCIMGTLVPFPLYGRFSVTRIFSCELISSSCCYTVDLERDLNVVKKPRDG